MMEAYKFSLESVLEWRTDKEKNVLEQLSKIQREFQDKNEILDRLIREFTNANKKAGKYKSINELQRHNLYVENIEERIEEQRNILKMIEERIDNTMDSLLEAKKDRRIIEKLKEKNYKLYLDELKKREQKELDEAAVFIRR